MENWLHFSDMIKLWIAKIKELGKTTSYRKLGTLCQIFFALDENF